MLLKDKRHVCLCDYRNLMTGGTLKTLVSVQCKNCQFKLLESYLSSHSVCPGVRPESLVFPSRVLLFIFALPDPTGIMAIFPFSMLMCMNTSILVYLLPLYFLVRCILHYLNFFNNVRITAPGTAEAHRRHR